MNNEAIVLIVEDDQLMVRMYERIFRLSDFSKIELAGNGEEALAKLATMAPLPAVILLDVMMPKMNGFEVLEHIQSDSKLKKIPVIMLSNLAGADDAKKALAMGAKLYLIKSEHTPKEVVEKVKEIIGGKIVKPKK